MTNEVLWQQFRSAVHGGALQQANAAMEQLDEDALSDEQRLRLAHSRGRLALAAGDLVRGERILRNVRLRALQQTALAMVDEVNLALIAVKRSRGLTGGRSVLQAMHQRAITRRDDELACTIAYRLAQHDAVSGHYEQVIANWSAQPPMPAYLQVDWARFVSLALSATGRDDEAQSVLQDAASVAESLPFGTRRITIALLLADSPGGLNRLRACREYVAGTFLQHSWHQEMAIRGTPEERWASERYLEEHPMALAEVYVRRGEYERSVSLYASQLIPPTAWQRAWSSLAQAACGGGTMASATAAWSLLRGTPEASKALETAAGASSDTFRQQRLRRLRDPTSPDEGLLGDFDVYDTVLGQGGQSVILAGVHHDERTPVAIKPLRAGAKVEASALAKLRHPGIIHVHSVIESKGITHLVLDRVEVADWPRNPTLLQIERMVRSVTESLAFAHGRGVLHLDVKQDNILVDTDGHYRWIDFGLAGPSDGCIGGTPRNMAPEQWQGATLGPWTDVYGLGCLIYRWLFGRPAFVGDDLSSLRRAHFAWERPTTPDDDGWASFFEGCFAVDYRRRYPSVLALHAALPQALPAERTARYLPVDSDITYSVCLHDSMDETQQIPIVVGHPDVVRSTSHRPFIPSAPPSWNTDIVVGLPPPDRLFDGPFFGWEDAIETVWSSLRAGQSICLLPPLRGTAKALLAWLTCSLRSRGFDVQGDGESVPWRSAGPLVHIGGQDAPKGAWLVTDATVEHTGIDLRLPTMTEDDAIRCLQARVPLTLAAAKAIAASCHSVLDACLDQLQDLMVRTQLTWQGKQLGLSQGCTLPKSPPLAICDVLANPNAVVAGAKAALACASVPTAHRALYESHGLVSPTGHLLPSTEVGLVAWCRDHVASVEQDAWLTTDRADRANLLQRLGRMEEAMAFGIAHLCGLDVVQDIEQGLYWLETLLDWSVVAPTVPLDTDLLSEWVLLAVTQGRELVHRPSVLEP